MLRTRSRSSGAERNFARWYLAQRPSEQPEFSRADGIRVVAFTDYQCPFCAGGIPAGERITRTFAVTSGLSVEYVVRDFPLDANCNPGTRYRRHSSACEAAAAVRVVRRHRGDSEADKVAAWLYERSRALSPQYISDKMSELGLADALATGRDDALETIARDGSLGASIGVTGTPTFVVNGVRLRGGATTLEHALRLEASRLQAAAARGAPRGVSK